MIIQNVFAYLYTCRSVRFISWLLWDFVVIWRELGDYLFSPLLILFVPIKYQSPILTYIIATIFKRHQQKRNLIDILFPPCQRNYIYNNSVKGQKLQSVNRDAIIFICMLYPCDYVVWVFSPKCIQYSSFLIPHSILYTLKHEV